MTEKNKMEKNHESEKIEAQRRFDALPENLKKEIQADKNVELIHTVCKDYSIPEEKVKYITFLVGEVFLGYIKPEEVAYQLNNFFDIDLQKSNFIEIELKQKLFNGLKADLDKIYNPIKIEIPAEETEEAGPAIIKIEADKPTHSEGLPRANPPLSPFVRGTTELPLSPFVRGTTELPLSPFRKGDEGGFDLAMTENESEAPFIIQTKVEAVKAAIPQFPKETPSLNLKVDPSIIQRAPIIKPISVRLETAQPVIEKKFQMPVIAGQKIFSGAPAEVVIPGLPRPSVAPGEGGTRNPTSEDPNIKSPNFRSSEVSPVLPPSDIGSPNILTKKPAEIKPKEPISPTLKQISEQSKEPAPSTSSGQAKVVHYSAFKTDLTHLGAPKQPATNNPRSTTNEGFINLNTFTKVSGNTVDLRNN